MATNTTSWDVDLDRLRLLPGIPMPRIALPNDGVALNKDGEPTFQITTARGAIRVTMGIWGWECRGKKDALIAHSLVAEAWLPGQPGNNRSMQTVVMLPDGRVGLGHWQGTMPKNPHIRIHKYANDVFMVRLQYSEAEEAEQRGYKERHFEHQRAAQSKDGQSRHASGGLPEAPGLEEMRKRPVDSPAQLKVGEHVFYTHYGYCFEATVVGGYQMYCAEDEDGPYMDANGRRVQYLYGYLIRESSGREGLMLAHQLRREESKPFHLCLVASR